jgi:biosynthetic threonine ammonia-lyase long form
MPRTTPQIKVQAVIDLGGEVILHGDDYDTALERALELARERSLVFVHPFDDQDVIAGQGTIGVELLRQTGGDVDAIFVPVGGGGLIAGIAVYVKYLYPNIRIIGVEPEEAASMYESLKAGRRVTLDRVGIFADGVAVKRVGEETFALCRGHVDEILLLDTDEICAAIQDVFEDTRSIVEPAGALAVAGLKKYVAREGWRDKRVIAINSGANINFDRLRHVAERADLGGEREALLAVTIPERPGSFLRFCELLGNRNVTEFNYRYESEQAAQIFVSFGLAQGHTEKDAVIRALRDAAYTVTDMTENEMAKLHVRYMVGGRARGIRDELLYRRKSGRCSSSSRRWAAAGTSACSTTATTAPTTGACWPASRSLRASAPISCSISTSCITPTRRRRIIRPIGCFWGPEPLTSRAPRKRRPPELSRVRHQPLVSRSPVWLRAAVAAGASLASSAPLAPGCVHGPQHYVIVVLEAST